MKIEIEEFKDVMKKSTLNYVIPSMQLNFKNNKIISNMISQSMDAVIMLSLDNNVLDLSDKDELSFNFNSPNTNIKPYIDLIDDDSVDIVIDESFIKLTTDQKQKFKFFFSSPDFVQSYKGDKPEIKKWFFDQKIDKELMNKFTKIKKIAGKFGKFYFSILNKKLYIESTDKQNPCSNSMKFELGNVNKNDFDLCFNFNNVNALLTLITKNYEDFSVKVHLTKDKNGGMLLFSKNDGSENYYFISKNE